MKATDLINNDMIMRRYDVELNSTGDNEVTMDNDGYIFMDETKRGVAFMDMVWFDPLMATAPLPKAYAYKHKYRGLFDDITRRS